MIAINLAWVGYVIACPYWYLRAVGVAALGLAWLVDRE
jgi:hypothetical protein